MFLIRYCDYTTFHFGQRSFVIVFGFWQGCCRLADVRGLESGVEIVAGKFFLPRIAYLYSTLFIPTLSSVIKNDFIISFIDCNMARGMQIGPL